MFIGSKIQVRISSRVETYNWKPVQDTLVVSTCSMIFLRFAADFLTSIPMQRPELPMPGGQLSQQQRAAGQQRREPLLVLRLRLHHVRQLREDAGRLVRDRRPADDDVARVYRNDGNNESHDSVRYNSRLVMLEGYLFEFSCFRNSYCCASPSPSTTYRPTPAQLRKRNGDRGRRTQSQLRLDNDLYLFVNYCMWNEI